MTTLRLPRFIEADPRAERILRRLTTDTRPLWPGSDIATAAVMLTPGLSVVLKNANLAGLVVRGLELAEHRLAREERGLRIADAQAGTPRGVRVSRLLLLADDGAERFYRNVEALLHQHGPRVLAIRLETDAATLGELISGPGSLARLLMLEHKDAVSQALLALTD